MKILFILPELNRGGAQNVVYNLIKGLKENDIECALIYLVKKSDFMKKDFQSLNIEVIHFEYKSFSAHRQAISKLIKKINPTTIHSHMPSAAFGFHFCLWLAFKGPILNTIHIRQEQGLSFRIKSFFSQFLISNFISVSCFTKAWHSRYFGIYFTKRSVIYNGVPGLDPIDNERIKNSRHFKILTVANFHPYKGYEYCLHALHLFKNRQVPFEYHICGTGNPEQKGKMKWLIEQFNLEQEVHLHGLVSDIRPLLAKSHLFLLLSEHEMLPISILEAISLGKPVIASKVGGIPEIFQDGAPIGYLEDYRNPLDIANHLFTLATDEKLYPTFSNNALKRSEKFRSTKMVEEHLKLYV